MLRIADHKNFGAGMIVCSSLGSQIHGVTIYLGILAAKWTAKAPIASLGRPGEA
jgi:hypothetical protein